MSLQYVDCVNVRTMWTKTSNYYLYAWLKHLHAVHPHTTYDLMHSLSYLQPYHNNLQDTSRNKNILLYCMQPKQFHKLHLFLFKGFL